MLNSVAPFTSTTLISLPLGTDLGEGAPGDIRLGREYDIATSQYGGRLFYSGERHLLIFGPSGTGKTGRLLIPNLLQCEDRSIFAVDPKGQLAAVTANYRRTLGPVHIINPFGVICEEFEGYNDLESQGFNPLAFLDPRSDSFDAEAADLAEAIVQVAGGESAYWDDSANSLLTCLIMYATIKSRQNDKVPTMAQVRDLLCAYSEAPHASNHERGEGIPAICLEMQDFIAYPGLRNMAQQFIGWNKEISGIRNTLMRHTKRFDEPAIRKDTSKPGMHFRRLKETPVTVYLICPPQLLVKHAMWVRMVLTSAINAVMRPRADGEPKVLFMLDEFAAYGKRLEIIETLWTIVRDYGVQMMLCVQGISQLKTMYQEGWETFVASAGAVLSFTPNDASTVEWLSVRGGQRDDIVASYHEGENINDITMSGAVFHKNFGSSSRSSSYNYSTQKVPFLDPHKLYGLPPGFTILSIAGLDDVVTGSAPLWLSIDECENRGRSDPYHGGKRKPTSQRSAKS